MIEDMNIQRRLLKRFTKEAVSFATGAGITGVIIIAVSFYLLSFFAQEPPIVPTYTLSNGSRTVVFHGMVHIGSAAHYASVAERLEAERAAGYVVFWEGVGYRPADMTDDERRSLLATIYGSAERVSSLNTRYARIAAKANLVSQSERLPIDLRAGDRIADGDLRWYAAHAGTLPVARENTQTESGPEQPSVLASALDLVLIETAYTERVRADFFRAVLSLTIGGTSRFWKGASVIAAEELYIPAQMDFVMTARDRILADAVLESQAKRISVVYGVGHFPGFYANLRAVDPSWHVIARDDRPLW